MMLSQKFHVTHFKNYHTLSMPKNTEYDHLIAFFKRSLFTYDENRPQPTSSSCLKFPCFSFSNPHFNDYFIRILQKFYK